MTLGNSDSQLKISPPPAVHTRQDSQTATSPKKPPSPHLGALPHTDRLSKAKSEPETHVSSGQPKKSGK